MTTPNALHRAASFLCALFDLLDICLLTYSCVRVECKSMRTHLEWWQQVIPARDFITPFEGVMRNNARTRCILKGRSGVATAHTSFDALQKLQMKHMSIRRVESKPQTS